MTLTHPETVRRVVRQGKLRPILLHENRHFMKSTDRYCCFGRKLFRSVRLPLLAVGLLLPAGCGSGEYNRRLEESLHRERRQSKFNEHVQMDWTFPYIENVGMALYWRAPAELFPPLKIDAHEATEAPLLEQPSGMQLPGLLQTIVQYPQDKSLRDIAYYCYLYRLPAGTISSSALQKDGVAMFHGRRVVIQDLDLLLDELDEVV